MADAGDAADDAEDDDEFVCFAMNIQKCLALALQTKLKPIRS